MEDIIIRPALLGDIAYVQQLSLQAFQYEHDHGFDRHLNMDWPLSEAAKATFRRLIGQEDGVLLVTARGTEIVGYLAGHLNKAGPQYLSDYTALLQGLFVAEHVRRRGIGEELVRRFLAWAREKGVAGVSVAVAPTNQPAVALYRKLGFSDHTLAMTL